MGTGFPYPKTTPFFIPVIRRKWKSYSLKCFILKIVGARLKAGFLLSEIRAAQANRKSSYVHQTAHAKARKCSTVLLTLPFQQHIRIECTLSSEWTGRGRIEKHVQSETLTRTRVRFDIVAPYMVHRQLSGLQKQSHVNNDAGAANALGLLTALERLLDSDTQLARLHEFAAHPDLLRSTPDEITTLSQQQEDDAPERIQAPLLALDVCQEFESRIHPLTKSFGTVRTRGFLPSLTLRCICSLLPSPSLRCICSLSHGQPCFAKHGAAYTILHI